MALTLASAADLLKEHHLLREIIQGDVWTDDPARIASADEPFAGITYDTRKVTPGALLCCKGQFKAEYLNGIDEAGLAAYVAETEYSAATATPGLIVNDARKAMSLLSAAFYGYPQNELTVIGVTGTKGKTTTSYFTQALINAVSGGKAALFSSVDNCLDGHTYVESDLTTPESMDAFRMMREAADNGMKYLVMEVSSQAYKVDRVYGLTFDVAAFLNISPDHISPIEHPTFEDYLYCKRQIIVNAKSLVLGADSLHADLLREDAEAAGIGVTTFALHDADNAGTSADVVAWPADPAHASFHIADGDQALGDYHLSIDGDFNYLNAAAAIAIAVGFATFENVCYLTENGAANFNFLLIRGISAGALHLLCGVLSGFGVSYVFRRRWLAATGAVGILGACIGFHAIYNLLITADGVWKTAGYLFPSLLLLCLYAAKQLLPRGNISFE